MHNDCLKNNDAEAKVGLTTKKLFDQVVLVGIILHQANRGRSKVWFEVLAWV